MPVIKSIFTLLFLLHAVNLNCAEATQPSESTDKFQFQPKKHDLNSLDIIASSKEINALSLNKRLPNEFSSAIFKSLNPRATAFNLNGTVDDLTVQFGAGSSMWLVVSYAGTEKKEVYRSDDDGLTYVRYTVFEDYSDKARIDSVFVNPGQKEFVIFSDLKNRVLFLSEKNGRGWRESVIYFTPDAFYFTDDSTVIMSFDKSNQQLWLTINAGRSWKLIGENVVEFQPEILLSEDKKQQFIYFMEKTEQGSTQLIRFDLTEFKYDKLMQNVQDRKHVVKKELAGYFSIGSSVFIVSKPDITGDASLTVSGVNGDQFKPVDFEMENSEAKQVIGFKPVRLNGKDKFIVVTYRMKNGLLSVQDDLYVSSTNSATEFELSLENIVNKCHISESLKYESCFDIRELNKAGYLFIANAINDEGIVETFIKNHPYSNDWEPSYYSEDETGLFLNLDTDFYQVHSGPESSFSPANMPDLMFSRVSQRGVYVSQEQGEDWTRILNDSYAYSVAFSEEYGLTVVVAAEVDKPTSKLRYSLDHGNSWNEWHFSDSLVMVDDIRVDPLTSTPAFLLMCTGAEGVNVMIKLDFSADFVSVLGEEEPSPVVDLTTTVEANAPTKSVPTETTTFPGEVEANAEQLIEQSFNQQAYEEAKSLIELSRLHLMILSQYMVPIFIFISSLLIGLIIYLKKKSLKHVSKSTSTKLVETYKSVRSKPIFRLSDQEKLIRVEEDLMV